MKSLLTFSLLLLSITSACIRKDVPLAHPGKSGPDGSAILTAEIRDGADLYTLFVCIHSDAKIPAPEWPCHVLDLTVQEVAPE